MNNNNNNNNNYLDLARELIKLWNVKVIIIPIVIGAFGTVTNGLLNGKKKKLQNCRLCCPG